MLKVSEAALTKINLEYIKFYDIVSVNTKPEISYYYLHRRYMEDPSSETNPLSLQSRAILCKKCKNKCSQRKGPPERSIANGWHLGINMRSLLPRLTVMELCAIRLVRVFRKIVKIVGASSTVAITGHVIALTNESCLDYEQGETWESLHPPKSEGTNNPILPYVGAEDVSIVFIGKFDFWNKIISIDPLTNRPRLMEPYHRVFGIDFNTVILWLQYLKVFSFEYHKYVLDSSTKNKSALENSVLNIIKFARIAESEEVLNIHKLSRLNHPNAPSATDKPEPVPQNASSSSSSSKTTNSNPQAAIDGKSNDLIFGSIDYSFIESNIPIEESTNPIILKTLLQSISDGLQEFVQKELEIPTGATDTPHAMDTSSPLNAAALHGTSPLEHGVKSIDLAFETIP
jgi:hypothetical protein